MISSIVEDYKILLENTTSHMISRHLVSSPDYPWLDTKFDILTGSDFDTNDPIRGHNTVYSWIQGRGLESIIGHIRCFICKLYDLSNKQPFNSDMPWWSLPETIRAAAYCWQYTKEQEFMNCLQNCHKVFFENYVVADRHYFQYQTLNKDAIPTKAIPASPDLDPNYHTGLSLIDTIKIIDS